MKRILFGLIFIGCAGISQPNHPDNSTCKQVSYIACENAINQSCEIRVWKACMSGLGWRIIDGKWKLTRICVEQ